MYCSCSGYIGENIAYWPTIDWTVGGFFDMWADEKKYYYYPSNTCSSMCGHYTQVISDTQVW